MAAPSSWKSRALWTCALWVTGLAGPECSPEEPKRASATLGGSLVQRGRPVLKTALGPDPPPEHITFTATVRDFTADHPDFESFDGHFTDLVESRLGQDGKPVYKGGLALSNKSSFDQWYRDTPGVNEEIQVPLTLDRTASGSYAYDSVSFFPIDGRGWNDTEVALDGLLHNFYFTLELSSTFVYRGGERFSFRGDDDVWVFIDRKLVIDLGGVHDPLERTVELDSLGLRRGAAVDLHFFFAERRCCGSNFRLETSIQFSPLWGKCVLWGDPHVSVFDRGLAWTRGETPVLGMYAPGDFWLVRTSQVSIQGRYGSTPWTPPGLSALLAIAVSGPFLRNHTLMIEPINMNAGAGRVTWSATPILESLPSEFFIRGFVNISYHGRDKSDRSDRSRLIDRSQRHLPLRSVTAHLPANVYLTVNRWARHLDAIIAMSQQPDGQDGHCGNFNGDISDDTREQILERIGQPLSVQESLFPVSSPATSSPVSSPAVSADQEPHIRDCEPDRRQEAEELCKRNDDQASNEILEACIFDVCFAGKQYAEEDGIVDQQVHDD